MIKLGHGEKLIGRLYLSYFMVVETKTYAFLLPTSPKSITDKKQ